MSVLAVIPCSKEKIWDIDAQRGAVRADQAYRSAFHKLSRLYAEKHADDWVILSAKYGFLCPGDRVDGPYDVTFGRPLDPYITQSDLSAQASEGWSKVGAVIVLCPSLYEQRVRRAFSFADVQTPLKGVGGWGAMHSFLRRAIV
jgi:hypothetical protein